MAGTAETVESATWADHALARLRDAGFRSGGSRRKVVEMIGDEACAVTALELDGRLEGVGRATVYRTLEQLEDLGLIQRIDVGTESAAFEKVDPRGHHHHHLVCRQCGRVTPFEDPDLELAIHRVSGRDDFEIESHDITLRGTCRDCT
jgi:Fur family transcriptional regulator, ferric uptake regulator